MACQLDLETKCVCFWRRVDSRWTPWPALNQYPSCASLDVRFRPLLFCAAASQERPALEPTILLLSWKSPRSEIKRVPMSQQANTYRDLPRERYRVVSPSVLQSGRSTAVPHSLAPTRSEPRQRLRDMYSISTAESLSTRLPRDRRGFLVLVLSPLRKIGKLLDTPVYIRCSVHSREQHVCQMRIIFEFISNFKFRKNSPPIRHLTHYKNHHPEADDSVGSRGWGRLPLCTCNIPGADCTRTKIAALLFHA